MRVTAWDRALAIRTGALSVLLSLLAAAVLVATDEREATFQTRLARLCALTPALASLAIVIVVRRLESAGDLRALAAMGVSRQRALGGSIALATTLGACAALALLLGWGSLEGLFPPLSGEIWRHEGAGFAAPGVVLESAAGAARFVVSPASEAARTTSRAAVAGCVALFAIGLPAWVTYEQPGALRAGVGITLLLGAIVCFHAVSAGRSAALLPLPPGALLAYLAALALRSRTHALRAPS